ncbi:MAG: response regulator, partial [Chitinophagaceae bacterium]|nr:response regulator [Chitinophagaceae bacterium]
AYMKVAIFDSSAEIIERLKELVLESNHVQSIVHANNFDDAWNTITETKPDIVIVDLNLQQNLAYDLIKKIHDNYKNIKIIVLSIHIEKEIQKQCLNLGAGYFFDKYHEFEKIPGLITSIALEKD